MGIAGQPMQVRNPDGEGVDAKAGPFLRSDLPIAGFAVIAASTLEEAVSLVSKTLVRSRTVSSRCGHWSRRRRGSCSTAQYEPSFVRARRLHLAPIAPALLRASDKSRAHARPGRTRRQMLRQCQPTGDEQAALRRLRRENRRQKEKRDMLAYSTELRAELGVEDLCLGGCELLVG